MKVKPTAADITMPELPPTVEWLNVPFLRMSTLLGRNLPLVWFWDYCSLNALRALPYVQEWHRRYADIGLRIIAVHSPQFELGLERNNVEWALGRLEIEFAVALDPAYEVWRLYGNELWPALYLWDRRGVLRYYHFGEGAYEETELAIQELLHEIDGDRSFPDTMRALRETDRPEALVYPPTPHQYLESDRTARLVAAGDELGVSYSGASSAAVLDGTGEVEIEVDGKPVRTIELDGPRLYELFDSGRHEEHDLLLRFRGEARAYAFSFAPGAAQ